MAKREGLSEEEAGRIARYDIFREAAIQAVEENQCEHSDMGEKAEQGISSVKIAVAHHMNDQAETVLMNIIRGSSMKGLCGMQPIRHSHIGSDAIGTEKSSVRSECTIIRPLLCVTRQEVEEYLLQIGQPFITDSTNADVEYTRNKLRNVVVPYLENNMNSNVVRKINDMAASVSEAEAYIAREADKLYEKCVQEDCRSVSIILKELGEETVLQKYIIRRAIGHLSGGLKDVYSTHVESVLGLRDMQVGRRVDIAYSITAMRKYDVIELYKDEDNKGKTNSDSQYVGVGKDMRDSDKSSLAEPNDTEQMEICIDDSRLGNLEIGEKYSVGVNKNAYTEQDGISFLKNIIFERVKTIEKTEKNDYTIYFDYDKIKRRMSLRYRREGDRIVVKSDGSCKKLKKELVDRKVPREYRSKVLLLALEEEILWLTGIRRSESAKVDKDSVRVIKVTIDN